MSARRRTAAVVGTRRKYPPALALFLRACHTICTFYTYKISYDLCSRNTPLRDIRARPLLRAHYPRTIIVHRRTGHGKTAEEVGSGRGPAPVLFRRRSVNLTGGRRRSRLTSYVIVLCAGSSGRQRTERRLQCAEFRHLRRGQGKT